MSKVNSTSGKIRIFIHKLNVKNDFEEWNHEYIYDGLLSDVSETSLDSQEWMSEHIGSVGFNYGGLDDNITEIIDGYVIGDVIEIYANYKLEGEWQSNHEYGDEYEEDCILENIQHRKLEDFQVERYFGLTKDEKDEWKQKSDYKGTKEK